MEFYYASSTDAVAASLSPTSSSSPPSLSSNGSGTKTSAATNAAPHVVNPCAACKILRRRCVDKCVLAPYFPPTEPSKFIVAHRVFGASNITKILQDLPEPQRADAVSSMVYEAGARIRDPVYGCAGTICQLQKQVTDLQAQLAKSQADLLNARKQQANLMALLCVKVANYPPPTPPPQLLDSSFLTGLEHDDLFSGTTGLSFLDDGVLTPGGSHMIWEALST